MEIKLFISELSKMIKLVLILLLFIFDVFIINLILNLYLKDSLSLIFAVILASILVIHLSINFLGGKFSKKLSVIFPLLSSLIIFCSGILSQKIIHSTVHTKIIFGILFIQLAKSMLVFIVLYYILKNLSIYFYEKHIEKMKNLDELHTSIKNTNEKSSLYRNILKIEIFFLIILSIWFYLFTELPNYEFFRIFYPIIALGTLYFSIKFIRNKI